LDEGFCSLRVGIFGKGVGRSSPHRRDIVFGQGVEGKEPDTPERNKADAQLGEILRILQALHLGGYQALPRLLLPSQYRIEDLVGWPVIVELHE